MTTDEPADNTSTSSLRVGVIGLGDIGRGVAGSFEKVGADLTVFDVRSDAADAFAASRVARSPSELADYCDVVLVAVVNDDQVRQVFSGPSGLLENNHPDLSVVILSTISTPTVSEVHAAAALQGVTVVDCGVSGGPSAAADGQLVCMVGGDSADLEKVRPALDVLGSLVLHMGPLGSGLSAKLAWNIVQYGSWLAAYEAQVLAEAAGINLLQLGQAIKASDVRIGGASTLMFRTSVKPFTQDADAGLVAAMRAGSLLAHKDLASALGLAETLDVDLPLAQLAADYCDRIFGFDGQPPELS